VNTVAVKLIQRTGVDKTISLARSMGIVSDVPDVPSISLGSSSISLMEMTAAYGCFANDGISVTPYFVTSVVDGTGKIHNLEPEKKNKQVLSTETVQLVTHLMKTVVQEGTASRIRWKYGVSTMDLAGKTG